MFAVSGYVCFRGWLPSWGSEAAWTDQLVDPFEFLPDVRSEIERVEDELVEPEDRGFRLSIAGDYLHKNNFSGGGQTEVPLPSDEADARVFEDDGVWFHHYASIAVAHGVDPRKPRHFRGRSRSRFGWSTISASISTRAVSAASRERRRIPKT